jgi:nucleoside phosphorylase
MAGAAATLSGVLGKLNSSLTHLEGSASATWLPEDWSLRTTELRRDLWTLKAQLGELPAMWPPDGDAEQGILLRAARSQVDQSTRGVETSLDRLQGSLPSQERDREFSAYKAASENLRSDLRRFRELLPSRTGSALAAAGLAEPDYVLEEQPWFAPEYPKTRETSHDKAEALRGRIDAVLITATKVELLAVLKPLRPLPDQRRVLLVYRGNETYYLGRFGRNVVAVTRCGMGSTSSRSVAYAAPAAQRLWRPRAVIMIGIAFGRDPAEQRIADVIVASEVFSYEPQRLGPHGIVPRGPTPAANDLLLNRFENADWTFGRPDGSRSRMIVGPVLSGEKLIDNRNSKDDLFSRYPRAVGGEMEGTGLGAAAIRAGTAWILVKGICDWADGQKNDKHQPLAAAAATSLVLDVLSRSTALLGLPKPAAAAE